MLSKTGPNKMPERESALWENPAPALDSGHMNESRLPTPKFAK